MATFEPYAGERKGKAWDAAASMLRIDEWVHRDAVVTAMASASAMQTSSCEAVLNEAKKAGWLRQDAALRLRVTEAGQLLRPELRPAMGA